MIFRWGFFLFMLNFRVEFEKVLRYQSFLIVAVLYGTVQVHTDKKRGNNAGLTPYQVEWTTVFIQLSCPKASICAPSHSFRPG